MFGRRLRVRVAEHNGGAKVVLRRLGQYDHHGIVVGFVNLTADDADDRLAEVRMKAKDMARQLNGLERG